MNRKIIPIFYACDNSFVKYTAVSLSSMIKNASDNYYYRIYILHNDISESGKAELLRLENSRFSITFINMNRRLEDIEKKLPIRDYYSKTTYYRIFIPEIFEGYDKVIYIDSDTVVQGDISELYETELGDSYVAACHEQVMIQVDEFGTYAEKTVGISRYEFFNAGVLLINCRKFREKSILKNSYHCLTSTTSE
jgi:lipopolysaccharide biosynthesis glycosyltransferase